MSETLTEAVRIAERDAWQNGLETITMTQVEFDALLEYSTTLPTGKTIGKQWKRQLYVGPKRGAWLLCEYVEDPDPAYVGVRTREIHLSLCGDTGPGSEFGYPPLAECVLPSGHDGEHRDSLPAASQGDG